MLVSWEWLSDYVNLSVGHEEMASRWAMTGLNHESTSIVGGDPVVDLEVTSNRGDCLGHIGVAREAAVLLKQELCIPQPKPSQGSHLASKVIAVENRFPDGCPRYIARVIKGVKVGPSPDWLKRRLAAIGVKSINNIVDATNYVMFECGQPLHAFDLAHVRGGKIIVRPAEAKEAFVAIDHKTYQLDPSMVVIADAERAIALGGVMGGVDSEVSDSTVDVLLETADFVPLSIRRTARKLKLHSPSSYRYERRIDPKQMEWASLRCCEMILQLAGGELASGSVDTGDKSATPSHITLRASRIRDVLGIEVPWSESLDILTRLGCAVVENSGSANSAGGENSATIQPPSYRMDLVREIDLIEEIARIHGYDKIPEDAMVPMVSSARRPRDVMMATVRNVCCGFGFDETMTPSLVGKSPALAISPWTDLEPLKTLVPLLEGASLLRRSLVPSLIASRLFNQQQSNRDVRLFETSGVYLPTADGLPIEQLHVGLLGDQDPRLVLGGFEEIIHRTCGSEFFETKLERRVEAWDYLSPGTGLSLHCDGKMLGWVGVIAKSIADSMKLDIAVAVGELNLELLLQYSRSVPQLQPIVPFPVVVRDLNLIVDETVTWKHLSTVARTAAGGLCIGMDFQEIYRDKKKDGGNKKRVLFSLKLQSATETLTSGQADEVITRVIEACKKDFDATLLA
ncbi:MAG: phenylalanine--tRNA ligase subunit beta [Pirellula sp.]|jgi:phenylalanyl-tRNA synthetase beta chain|nr:phenylalanine--tRNA ligase subunit beta [Pirellula sp.]